MSFSNSVKTVPCQGELANWGNVSLYTSRGLWRDSVPFATCLCSSTLSAHWWLPQMSEPAFQVHWTGRCVPGNLIQFASDMKVIWGGPAVGMWGKDLCSLQDSTSNDLYRSYFPDNSFLSLLLLLANWKWTHLCMPPFSLLISSFIFDTFHHGEGTNNKCFLPCDRSVAPSAPTSPWRCSHSSLSRSQGETW